jgi:lipoprotein-anchoring transpeptidase ErfK/SrfK
LGGIPPAAELMSTFASAPDAAGLYDTAPTPPAVWTMARAGVVAAGLVATTLAGFALVSADEQAGTAHVPLAQLQALRPELRLGGMGPDRPAAPNISFDKPASAIEAEATSLANRAPGEGSTAAATMPGTPAFPDRRFVVKRILPISTAIRYGEWHWDEAGIPPGPTVITVDLQARVLSIFRGGYEIGTAAVLLGTQEKPTPLGTFPISQKDAHHVSNLYDAPMPYMLRLTNDGVTIHATNVQNGYASHGCIGVPIDFAKKLFAAAKLGDKVFITRGKTVGLGDALVD